MIQGCDCKPTSLQSEWIPRNHWEQMRANMGMALGLGLGLGLDPGPSPGPGMGMGMGTGMGTGTVTPMSMSMAMAMAMAIGHGHGLDHGATTGEKFEQTTCQTMLKDGYTHQSSMNIQDTVYIVPGCALAYEGL